MVTMTFGKWKGSVLTEVPTDYLVWMVQECQNISRRLREAAAAELATREPTKQRMTDFARVVRYLRTPLPYSPN